MPHAQLLALIDAVPTVVWDRSVPLDEIRLTCETDDGNLIMLKYTMGEQEG